MIATVFRLLHADGQRTLRRLLVLSALTGLCHGLAMISLFPAASALASGRPAWGLDLWGWVGVLAALALVAAAAQYFVAMASYRTAFSVMYSLSEKLGDRIATLPLGWFHQGRVGEISQLAAKGIMDMGSMLAHMLGPLFQHGAATVVLAIGAWLWDWRLGLFFTVALPVLVAALRGIKWVANRAAQVVYPAEVEVNNRVLEFARSQGALRSCGRSGRYEPLERAVAVHKRRSITEFWMMLGADGFGAMIVQFIVVVLILVTGWLAIAQLVMPIEALVMIGLSLRYAQTLDGVVQQTLGTTVMSSSLSRAREVLDAQPLPTPDEPNPAVGEAAVELDRVKFAYGAAPVLRNVSFQVPNHTMTALVGPSGSGKTTIARLIARFYDVDGGTVRVGGVDVRDMPTEQLMAQLSMVFQDVYLFDDTLRANIAVGSEGASDRDIAWAADLAGVTEIVERLPHGWDTRVGEGGAALSGGERQRVSIARALLKDAPIVLFDEATSALDPENEAHIVDVLHHLRERSTLLVIAHKLGTIAQADQIVVLDADGSVAQVGTHSDLIAEDGPYRAFWDERARAVGWRLAH